MSAFYNILHNHTLWNEMRTLLNLSNPAYTYWQDTNVIKLSRYLFLDNDTIPERYLHIVESTSDLSGYLPTRYAADQLNIDTHIFNTKQMRLNTHFEYKFVQGVKFVNIKRFFTEHGIVVNKNSLVSLSKLESAIILPNSRLYTIDAKYAVVVYD